MEIDRLTREEREFLGRMDNGATLFIFAGATLEHAFLWPVPPLWGGLKLPPSAALRLRLSGAVQATGGGKTGQAYGLTPAGREAAAWVHQRGAAA